MEQKTETKFVTKDMVIGDVLKKYPDAAVIMLEHGLHCVGCHANVFDTIEAGCQVHGLDAAVVDSMVDQINNFISEAKEASPVQEGLAKVTISDAAASKLRELMVKDKIDGHGLRVAVSPGGCSGFVYQMNFEPKAEASDIVLEDKDVKIFIDKDSLDMLRGAEIDYVETLNDSGFKVNNPNAKHGCGCGKSFG